jgi:hypothetical protein
MGTYSSIAHSVVHWPYEIEANNTTVAVIIFSALALIARGCILHEKMSLDMHVCVCVSYLYIFIYAYIYIYIHARIEWTVVLVIRAALEIVACKHMGNVKFYLCTET